LIIINADCHGALSEARYVWTISR